MDVRNRLRGSFSSVFLSILLRFKIYFLFFVILIKYLKHEIEILAFNLS